MDAGVKLGIACGLAFFSGTGFGAGLANHFLRTKYERLADEEIAKEKLTYAKLFKTGEFSDPVRLAENSQEVADLAEAMVKNLEYAVDAEPDPDDPPPKDVLEVARNVFTNAKIIDYQEELDNRDTSKPYIVSNVDFFASDMQSSTLTYFEGDEVLADEHDEHIREVDETVGLDNLARFGHLSGDKNVVYVRNEAMDVQFEIIRSTGKYAREVLGFIEHSEKRGVRKFRSDYD